MSVTTASLQAQIAQLQAQNAALLAARASRSKISFKVSEKGALSVYGLQRFPVTLYREQWERIFAHADEFKTFIAANDATLTKKEVV